MGEKIEEEREEKMSFREALPREGAGGGGLGGFHVARLNLKRLVSVIINASRLCRKLNENSLSLLEFWKRGIAMHYKETITVLQFLS